MKIPRKMQVQIFHGHHLCIAAAGSAALYPETGPEGRFSERDHGLKAEPAKCLSESYTRSRLPLTRRRGVDRRHENQFSVRITLYTLHIFIRDLGLVLSVQLKIIRPDPDLPGNLHNIVQLCLLCDLNIRFHAHPASQPFFFYLRHLLSIKTENP